MKNPLTIVIIAVAAWCGGIVLAPIVADTVFGTMLYRFYAVVCHQFESRSLAIAGNHMAVCARCTGIYAGFLIGLIAIRLIAPLREFRPHAITAIAVSVFPMVLHVIVETLNVIEPSISLRIVTGLWSGAGFSMILHRSLTEIIHSRILIKNNRHETTTG
jgi:uncharacterized membrane protein